MSADLTAAIFNDDANAREWLEAARWPNGPVCAHCGSENVHRLEGEAHRAGLLYCRACRKQFSVTVGSVMERSHVPLPKWVLAFHLMAASKKGVSAHQLHRMLKVTYKLGSPSRRLRSSELQNLGLCRTDHPLTEFGD